MKSLPVGLDLGGFSFKGVTIVQKDKKVMIENLAEVEVALLSSEAEKMEALKNLLVELKIRTREIIAAIPEIEVSTRIINIPQLSDAQIAQAIKWEAEQYIPLPISEVILDYDILDRPKDNASRMRVMLVAAPISLVAQKMKFFEQVKLEAKFLETESLSLLRLFKEEGANFDPAIYLHVGANYSIILLVDSKGIVFSKTANFAGNAFTRAIAQSLEFETIQAEEYKRNYGLLPGKLNDRVFSSLKPVVDILINEIKKAEEYYRNLEEEVRAPRRILLSGGSARLPGFAEYITAQLGIEVDILKNPQFEVAYGLALRSV